MPAWAQLNTYRHLGPPHEPSALWPMRGNGEKTPCVGIWKGCLGWRQEWSHIPWLPMHDCAACWHRTANLEHSSHVCKPSKSQPSTVCACCLHGPGRSRHQICAVSLSEVCSTKPSVPPKGETNPGDTSSGELFEEAAMLPPVILQRCSRKGKAYEAEFVQQLIWNRTRYKYRQIATYAFGIRYHLTTKAVWQGDAGSVTCLLWKRRFCIFLIQLPGDASRWGRFGDSCWEPLSSPLWGLTARLYPKVNRCLKKLGA